MKLEIFIDSFKTQTDEAICLLRSVKMPFVQVINFKMPTIVGILNLLQEQTHADVSWA